MSALLEVEAVGVRFGTAPSPLAALMGASRHVDVLIDVSLTLQRGETLAIVGESGSGKTTLGRALIGLLPVHQGRITFQGEDVTDRSGAASERRTRGMSMMFQDPVASLSPRLNVLQLVTEPFAIHRIDPPGGETQQQAGLRLLSLVGLNEHFAKRFPHELSGGQARRVGVARALALRPQMIIADEPTAGLDVSIQGATLNLLTGLQREFGLSLLLITHNLAVVRHVADRVAVMYMGRIVELGTTRQILGAPRHPYTQFLVAAQPRLGVPIEETRVLQGELPSLLKRGGGCDFRGRCPLARDICRTAHPPAVTADEDHTVLCHFAAEGVVAA